MKRLKIWCGTALLLSILLIGVIIFVSSSTEAAPPATQLHHPSTTVTSRTETSYVLGVPAISPSGTTKATITSPSTSVLTKQDVISYLNQKKPFDVYLVQGAHVTIASIQFVTAKQASILMNGETVGRPDDDLVCYVRVQGPFSRLDTHLGPYSPGKKVILTAKFAHMVFDGQTGNMLVWGMENA